MTQHRILQQDTCVSARLRGTSREPARPDPPGSSLARCFFVAMSLFLGIAIAHAGTLTNTAHVDFGSNGTIVTRSSNTVDTTTTGDTVPPTVGEITVGPSLVNNDGETVSVSITADDSAGISAVLADLRLLNQSESTPLRDDGVAPDTTANDDIWNLIINVDGTVSGDTYFLPVTIIDSDGNQRVVTIELVVVDTSPAFVEIISMGWNVTSGMRLSGNAITLSVGHDPSFKSVFFEYRGDSDPVWTPCAIGTWSDPNPDTEGPMWGILWNTEGLPDGGYRVRATAITDTGETDLSPSVVRVYKDNVDSWVNEWNDTALGIHVRRHRYSKWSSDTVVVVEGTMFSMLPAAMVSSDTLWIRITVFRTTSPDAPPPSAGSGLIIPGNGYYRRFEREDGRSAFDDWVTMEIPYDEEGLTVAEKDLAIYHYDTGLAQWILDPGAEVDEERNVVRVRVRHFTDFAVFGAAASADLSGVLVYPNPYIPYDGDDNTGRPFVRGDNTTGIIFKNVTNTVDIDIFTITGRRVSTIHATNTGGNLQWDARTDDNREVASGVYIAVIKSGTGQQVVKKFMVIR